MFLRVIQFLYPHHCSICNVVTHDKIICDGCFASGIRKYNYCEQCGEDLVNNHCVKCEFQSEQNNIDHYIIGYNYGESVKKAIIHLKFNRKMYMTRVIKELMKPVIEEHKSKLSQIDWIVPMPIDRVRLANRGFNHMLELSMCLQGYIDKPILYNKLHKTAFSIPQSQLSKQERANNLKDSLSCDKISGRILLLDDVLTTGATLKYASLALKQAGAANITALIFSKV